MRSGLPGRLFAVFSSAKSVIDRERQCTLQADTQIGVSGRACISKRWSGGEVEDFQDDLELAHLREDLNSCFSIFLLGFKLNIFLVTRNSLQASLDCTWRCKVIRLSWTRDIDC